MFEDICAPMVNVVKNSQNLHYCPGGVDASDRLMKTIGFSVVFHALLLLCAGWLNHSSVRTDRPLIIDLSLSGRSISGRVEHDAPKNSEGRPAIAAKQNLMPKQKETLTAETSLERPLLVPASGSMSPAQSGQSDNRTEVKGSAGTVTHGVQSGAAKNISNTAAGEMTAARSAGSSAGEVQNKYLKEHFAYIKDLVQRQVLYPAIARNMGWEGRVVVSFMITHDGTVKEVKVIESKGAEVLNRCAVDAVKRAAPFPGPPAEAQIVLPIEFRLH